MAVTWDDLGFFNRPIGPMRRVGVDELGNATYQTLGGQTVGLDYSQVGPVAQPQPYWQPTYGRLPEYGPRERTIVNTPGTEVVRGLLDAVTQGFTAPGRALRGDPVTYGDVAATALDYGLLGAPMTAPAGAVRSGAMRTQPDGIIAYHGSPHTFDRFSMDAIGTGEGAQAYGHGLYFAENEAVARGYRNALSDTVITPDGTPNLQRRAAQIALTFSDNTPSGAIEWLKSRRAGANYTTPALTPELVDEVIGLFESGAFRPGGSMYQVRLNVDPQSLLNWDAPLSEQSPQVRSAVDAARDAIVRNRYGERAADFGSGVPTHLLDGLPANRAFGSASGEPLGSPAAAAALREAGVPGIQYLDAGSRAAGTGTRNFVIFDDSLIDILKRYGIGAATFGGGWALTQEEAQAMGLQ